MGNVDRVIYLTGIGRADCYAALTDEQIPEIRRTIPDSKKLLSEGSHSYKSRSYNKIVSKRLIGVLPKVVG